MVYSILFCIECLVTGNLILRFILGLIMKKQRKIQKILSFKIK
jgi:hypothetical protein